MRTMLRGLLAVSVVLAIGACGGDDDDDGGTGAGAGAGGDGQVEVAIADFAFDPSELSVPAGEATFAVTNDDTTAHTFTIEEVDLDIAVGAGESAEGTATLEAGDYEAVCRIHPTMTATVSVS